MMTKITHLNNNTSLDELKSLLLKRNNKWSKIMDGSSTINGSLKTVVLSCIDSRVPIEKIFQAKPGELLVLKNAGNIIRNDVVRSILVAIYELNANFLIVLGHTHCGMAIKNNNNKIEHLSNELGEDLLKNLKDRENENPIQWFGFFDQGKWDENVFTQIEKLEKLLKKLIPIEKQPVLIPAIYDIESGKVKFL